MTKETFGRQEVQIAAPPAKTVIVGSTGRMGAMLLKKAEDAGISVGGVDLPFTTGQLKPACADAAMALICVPARHLETTIRKITPFLPDQTILADITSVKELPMRVMQKLWPGSVVGTHPLFGPAFQPDDDLPVAITPGQNAAPEQISAVSAFFQSFGCRVFTCSAEKHDQAMARIQNMNFITNLAYFAALSGQTDLLPFITPSFKRRKMAAAKMLNEDAEMFCGLFEANPHSMEAARQYRQMLNIAAAGDIELLCKRAQWWWTEGEKN